MPPLVMLGRRWLLGSDDFVYPTLIDLAIRVVRLILAYIWLCNNWLTFPCIASIYATVYYVGFCAIVTLIAIANTLIIHRSAQGGIMDSGARKHIPPLLLFRLILQLVELIWTSLGTSWLYRDFFKCEGSDENIGNVDGTITANWVFIGLFVFFFTINLAGSKNISSKQNVAHTTGTEPHILCYKDSPSTKSWTRTWRMCFCSCHRKDALVQNGFKQIGHIAANLFDDCDLVPSDVVVGMAVTSVKQKQEREKLGSPQPAAIGSTQTYLNLDLSPLTKSGALNPQTASASGLPSELLQGDSWNSFARINRFNQYAISLHTYTAIYLQRRNPCNIFKRQCEYSAKFLSCSDKPFILNGDCCFCLTSSLSSFIEQSLDDNQTTLVHISFLNSYFKLPYMVAIDHLTKSVLVAIRGTMTKSDVFTDIVADAELMSMIPGIPKHFKCHSGFLQAASALKSELDGRKLIFELMNTFPTYNLVTTGNSLGAAAAIILAMMYRPKYPSVKCFAFSTPAFLSLDAGDYCNDFVQTVIYGNDMVARLSVRSVKNLLHEIEATLRTCKTPKYQIQLQMMLKALCLRRRITVEFVEERTPHTLSGHSLSTSEVSIAMSDSPILPVEYNYGSSFKYVLPQESESEQRRSQLCPLYPPGKILHVTPSKLFREGRGDLSTPKGPRWNIRWANRTEFGEIVVRSRMFLDHQPARLHRALRYFESLQTTGRCIVTIS